jgi:hypothetical protein
MDFVVTHHTELTWVVFGIQWERPSLQDTVW